MTKAYDTAQPIRALADENHYPAVLAMLPETSPGKVLDVPSGHGALAQELLKRGYKDIHCLDIAADTFALNDERVAFRQYDAINPLPYPDAHFDLVLSIEGIEHFLSPWPFVAELCRVLKPGGRLVISTPNTFSVDARLKYLMSGYFPRFRPLMLDPARVMNQPVDDAHICPIYFWQLNFILMQGGVDIKRVSTNARLYKPQWIRRVFENWVARLIRNNMKKRGFPDKGVSSEEVMFGDCLIVEGVKSA